MNASARAKLEAAAAGISLAQISGTGRKTALVQFRLSEADKASIQRTADSLGLSVSEYLLRLHSLVAAKIVHGNGALNPPPSSSSNLSPCD